MLKQSYQLLKVNNMKIGIDLNSSNICGVLVNNDIIINSMTETICSYKRDNKKEIMGKLMAIINYLVNTNVKVIGLSLPTKIDPSKGTVFDLDKIPHWKGIRIKKIIEDKFKIPTRINTDVNCYILGEKYHGACKNYKDAVCIFMDSCIGTSTIINDNLYIENKDSYKDIKCLSQVSFSCVKYLKKSYMRAAEEITYLTECFTNELQNPEHEAWNNIGLITGRLISVLLANYNPQVIILGGNLVKPYNKYAETVSKYLELFSQPNTMSNRVIIPSKIDNARAIGACYIS